MILLHVRLVVALGAQVLDGAAEQPPLHAGLHHQRQVRHREHLDHRDRRTDVAGAAVLLAERVGGGTERGHDPHLLGHLGAGDHRVRRVVRAEEVLGHRGPHPVLHVAPTPVQGVAQMFGSACRVWRHNPTVTRHSGLANKSGNKVGTDPLHPTCIRCEFGRFFALSARSALAARMS